MAIQYPKGSIQRPSHQLKTKRTDYSSRGMFLETVLNQTNEGYLLQRKAVIHKKPTPIQVVSVHYPKRSAAQITEAYFRQPSTTDYNGVYNGYYIDFEAKETKNKTSFPIQNIHEHQLHHMNECLKQGGIVFFIFYFSTLQQFYLVDAELIIHHIRQSNKSAIPLTFIQEHGYAVAFTIQSTIDYLAAVDQLIEHKRMTQSMKKE